MAAILRSQMERYGLGGDFRNLISRFERPNACVVVAGQQPGLFGGPLYTLYKAITAIRLARSIEAATGQPAVPLFWVASDDHDFEEVRRTWLTDGHEGDLQVLEYPAEAAPPSASFARIRLGPEVGPLLARLDALLPSTGFKNAVLDPLREAYAPGRSWSEAFARFLGSFVAPLGALVFDPSDPEAKALAEPVFEREIELAGQSSKAAHDVGEALVARGYHAQIARMGNELNFFWHGRDGREAIRITADGTFRSAVTGRTWSRSKLLADVRAHPENASPGVLLRPLVQDFLLPTAGYVGGPAEVAYWAQVYALYPSFEIEPPAIVPRGGATLLEARVQRTLERFGIPWSALAGDVEVVIREALRAKLPEDFRDLFDRERAGWLGSFERLREQVVAFDPSLEAAVANARGRVEHEAEILEKKLLSVWKRRHEESVRHIRRARALLFPNGHLQERVASPLGFAARHGPWLLSCLERAVGEPGVHVPVTLGGSAA